MTPKFKAEAIVVKNKRSFLGVIENDLFIEDEEIKGPQTLKDNSDFVPIHRYFEILGMDLKKKDIQEILKKYGATDIYIKDTDPIKGKDKITPAMWNKYFFKFPNKKCNRCKKSCKQSSRVIIDYCPDFEEIKGEK